MSKILKTDIPVATYCANCGFFWIWQMDKNWAGVQCPNCKGLVRAPSPEERIKYILSRGWAELRYPIQIIQKKHELG